MNTWKIILATVVIFATGVITGGLLVGFAGRGAERPARIGWGAFGRLQPQPGDVLLPAGQGRQPFRERQRMEFILAAHRELDLTPHQRERIEKIIREGQEKTRTVLEKVGPELRKEWREVREKIRAELTPAQRKRFEELLRQRPPRGAESPPGPGRGPRDQRVTQPRDLPPSERPPIAPPPANPPPPGVN